MKILLIQLRQLGDILLTTPVLRAIKQAYPKAEIHFLSHSMGRLVLSGQPLVNKHWIYPTNSLADELQFLWSLRRAKFSLVFDFMGNPRSAFMSFATAAERRFCVESSRNWAYTTVIPRVSGTDYIVLEKFRLLEAAGIHGIDQRLLLPWSELDLAVAHDFFTVVPPTSTKKLRVVLSATHRRVERRWPSARWITLAEWLVKSLDADVIWLWGPGEKEFVEDLKKNCSVQTYLAPQTTFRELAAFIAQCDLFVGNSNGPSHVAVAVNTPSLHLHGPTDAPSWTPMTNRHRAIAKPTMDGIETMLVSSEIDKMTEILKQGLNHRNTIRSSEDVWRVRPNL